MMKFHSKNLCLLLLLVLLSSATTKTAAQAAVKIDDNHDLHDVLGDLYALQTAMFLYYDDSHQTKCPDLEQLSFYFNTKSTAAWPENYRAAEIDGIWWVGRAVPEITEVRKFLRDNAETLKLWDKNTKQLWLGGKFVWLKAVEFDRSSKPAQPLPASITAMQGDAKDNQHLFFNTNGNDLYWRSSLIFTTDAHLAALKKFAGRHPAVQLILPEKRPTAKEKFTATPVDTPQDFTVGSSSSEDEEPGSMEMGDVIVNPMPRPYSRD